MSDEEPGARPSVLLVEDERNVRELVGDLLARSRLRLRAVGTIAEARAALERELPDLLLLDLRLPDGDGLELLEALRARGVTTPAILLTAFGTVERAVAAMRAGASDFLVKPFDNDRFRAAVDGALAHGGRLVEVELRAGEIDAASLGRELVGAGGGLRGVMELLGRVAALDSTVLITGESGTGKQLVARAIHDASPRLDGPFQAIDCSAIAPTLLESELFGFERGAFTGAHAQRKGLVEAAHGGTLFLDEIGDMPLEAQSRLLRVLQERQIVRLGGRQPIPVDVRVVAATHRDLGQMATDGRFRSDLLYRLAVVPIRLPPLRARPEDVPGLVDHFLERFTRKHRVALRRPEGAALEQITRHGWPGNVRELENFVERSVVLGRWDVASLEPAAAAASSPRPEPEGAEAPVTTLRQAVAEAERRAVVAALRKARGNKAEAARLLGVSYKTLFNKIHEHDIREETSIE